MKGIWKHFPALIVLLSAVIVLPEAAATMSSASSVNAVHRSCQWIPGDNECVFPFYIIDADYRKSDSSTPMVTWPAVARTPNRQTQRPHNEYLFLLVDERHIASTATHTPSKGEDKSTTIEALNGVLKKVVVPVHEPTTFALFMAVSLFLVIRRMNK